MSWYNDRKVKVMTVFFHKQKKISAETLIDLKQYIDNCLFGNNGYAAEKNVCAAPQLSDADELTEAVSFGSRPSAEAPAPARQKRMPRRKTDGAAAAPRMETTAPRELTSLLEQTDESFSEMLLRKIDEKHMTDAQCYKKAQIDRKLFSKIRSHREYRPSKSTALSFALALELSLAETSDLLLRAGYALSHSSKADIIVEYFILHRIYDKFLVNEALYEFDQPLL